MMTKVPTVALVVHLLLLATNSIGHAQAPSPTSTADLATMLESLRASGKLPALAAAVIIDGHLAAIGAVGVRQLGSPTPVGVRDRFHLGSDTKAMTATLAAMLVQEGCLQWQAGVT